MIPGLDGCLTAPEALQLIDSESGHERNMLAFHRGLPGLPDWIEINYKYNGQWVRCQHCNKKFQTVARRLHVDRRIRRSRRPGAVGPPIKERTDRG